MSGTENTIINASDANKSRMIDYLIQIGSTYFPNNDNQFINPSKYYTKSGTTPSRYADPQGNIKTINIILNLYQIDNPTTQNFFKLNTTSISSSLNDNTDSQNSDRYCSTNKTAPCMILDFNNSMKYLNINNIITESTDGIENISLLQYIASDAVSTEQYNGSPIKTIDLYKGLYALYSITYAPNMLKLRSGSMITISIPNDSITLETTNRIYNIQYVKGVLSYTNVDTTDTTTDLNRCISSVIDLTSIIKDNNFDLFTFRQIIYLHIQYINLGLALHLYNQYSKTPANFISAYERLKKLISIILDLIDKKKIGYESVFRDVPITQKNDVNSNIGSSGAINKRYSQIQNIQDSIKENRNIYANETSYKYRIRNYIIFAIIILIIILGISVYIEIRRARQVKYIGCLVILTLAIVSYIVIHYLYGKTLIELFTTTENFQASNSNMNITSPINGNQVSDTTIQNNIRYFESINYKSTSDTLSAFISLVDKLKAANTAANFDVLVSTERRYYLAKFNELNNANDKLNSASVLTRIDKINNSSLLNYLLNLILIVSMTEIIRVLISVYNNLVPFYILIIGIIFVIIATIIFVIERTRRVRTDPDKIYWKESNEK